VTDTTHECPRNGCTRRVPARMLACRSDWYRVSAPTRQRVWETYRAAPGSAAHLEACAQAISEMNAEGQAGG
jgi:hypothetical protein